MRCTGLELIVMTFVATAIEKSLHPEFERQELPNLHRPVSATAAVFVDKPTRRSG